MFNGSWNININTLTYQIYVIYCHYCILNYHNKTSFNRYALITLGIYEFYKTHTLNKNIPLNLNIQLTSTIIIQK